MKNIPAIHGGKPVIDKYLHYGHQFIDDDDINSVIAVLKGDFLTTGPIVKKFEEKICEYIGCKYAVAFSNGTAALHAACYVAGISSGDEVITSPLTFVASANCILYCGGTPVFADINSNTYNICHKEIEKKITPNTKAIIIVDFTGQVADLDKINEVAKKNNLIVIEDAAHAFGTKYKGIAVGTVSHMTTFSFHPVKTITTGEGGAVTTNSKDLYEKLLLFRSHGITRNKKFMENKHEGSWYYEQVDFGYNYRLTDIQCALGISQLAKVDKFIKRRKELVNMYNDKLKYVEGVILQKDEDFSDTSRHLYIISLKLDKFKVGRKEIFEALKAENIGVNVHYIPVYLHPYYKNIGYTQECCENAEKLYNSMITLPLHTCMTDDELNHVVEAVNKVLNYYRV